MDWKNNNARWELRLWIPCWLHLCKEMTLNPSPCYLCGHYHNVGSVWAKLSSGLILMYPTSPGVCWCFKCWSKTVLKEVYPNVYSEWQFWHLTMHHKTDRTNLMHVCVGCKHTAARKLMIIFLLPRCFLIVCLLQNRMCTMNHIDCALLISHNK